MIFEFLHGMGIEEREMVSQYVSSNRIACRECLY